MLPVISPERLYSGQSSPPSTVRLFIQLIISSASSVTRLFSRSTELIGINLKNIIAFYHSSTRYFLIWCMNFCLCKFGLPFSNRGPFMTKKSYDGYIRFKLYSQLHASVSVFVFKTKCIEIQWLKFILKIYGS